MAHAWNASNGTLLPGEKNGDTRQRKAGVPGNRDIGTEALLTHAETADGVGRLEGDTLKAPSTVLVHWDHPSVAPDGVTFVPSIWDQSNPRATTIVSHSAAYPSYGPPACLLQPEEIGYLRNAVLSLYADQIRPYQSEVVRRLKLFEPTALVIQNALHFYRILTDIFIVEKTNHSRMVVYLRTKPTWFQGWIDPKSAEDPYKPSMWNELRQYLSGLSFVTSILRELVDSKSSPRTLNCTEVLRETGEIAADEFAMALSPSAALLFFGIRRALRDGRHQDKEELVESTAGSHRVVHPRTRNTSVSLRLTAEGKTTERPPEESPVPFQKTTANAMTPPDRLAHMHEFCCPTDTVPNSCSPAAALRPSSPSSFREKMLLPASPWQIAGQKLGSQSAGTVVLASSHFFSALKDASHHVARSVSSRSSSPISPSSQTSASPVSPLCLHANAEVSYEAFAPSVEVSESVGGPRPPCKDRSLASCFASCSLHARQEEAIRTLVQAVLLEARTSTTNDGTLETSTQSARRDDTPADTLPQERETAAVDSPVLRTSQFRGEKAIEPTESTRSEISAGNSRAATGKLHLPLPVAPGCTPGPRASAYSGSLAPSVLKREEQGIDESVPSRFKDRGRVKEGSEARLEDDGAWRREPELQNSTASLLQLPRSTEFRTLSDSLTESYQSDSASPASSIRSKAQGESALPEYATGLETLVSVALPLARGVALRVQSALAAGLEPDTFSRGRYGTAVALKRHGPVSLRSFTLGCLCHVVQLSVDRSLLRYVDGFLQACPPGSAGSGTSLREPAGLLAEHATAAAVAAAALTYLELLLQGDVTPDMWGLSGGEADLTETKVPSFSALGQTSHAFAEALGCGGTGSDADCCTSSVASSKNLPKIGTVSELRRLVAGILASNQNAVMLSQLRGKLVDTYGVSLSPETFRYSKLSDLLLGELSDVCSLWCHGDRQLIVHEAAYEPDPSTYPADQRPTRITVSRSPSYAAGKHQHGRVTHWQRHTGDEKHNGYSSDTRHHSGGHRAWSHPTLAPGRFDPPTRPAPSAAAQTPRNFGVTQNRHRQSLGVLDVGADKLCEVCESLETERGWESSRSLPVLPQICQRRPRTKDPQCGDYLPVTRKSLSHTEAGWDDSHQDDLAESVRQLQLFQLQENTARPTTGSREAIGVAGSLSLSLSRTMGQEQDSPNSLFCPCCLQFVGEQSLPATSPLSNLRNRANLGPSAALELGDTAVDNGLPDVRLRCQSDSHLDVVGPFGQQPATTSGSGQKHSRSYTALPLSPTLRPREEPPQAIQSRWMTTFPDSCPTPTVAKGPKFIRSCGAPPGAGGSCTLPRQFDAAALRRLHVTQDPLG